jgi:hypothetical protein
VSGVAACVITEEDENEESEVEHGVDEGETDVE